MLLLKEAARVFDQTLKGIAGEEKMKGVSRRIFCPWCLAMGKEDRVFKNIGDGFEENDTSEECCDVFGKESGDERHSIKGIWTPKKEVSDAESRR